MFVCIHNSTRSQTAGAFLNQICDEASAERCPIFPGITKRLHWSFPDPSAAQGSHEEKLARTREIRDLIKTRIEAWCGEVCSAVQA